MEYHPGGIEELMKCAGIDGTALFDEVHKWVNYESMLQKCFIGKLASSRRPVPQTKAANFNNLAPPSSVLSKLLPKKPLTKDNLIEPSSQAASTSQDLSSQVSDSLAIKVDPPMPKFDWYQTDTSVCIIIYTYMKNKISSENVIIDKEEQNFYACVRLRVNAFLVNLELLEETDESVDVKVQTNTGKIDIILRKTVVGKQWNVIGKPKENHKKYTPCKDLTEIYRKSKVVAIEQVTHDTKLIELVLPPGSHMVTPTGHHIHLRHAVQGMTMVRSYTVVVPSLQSKAPKNGTSLYLLIKIYKDGVLTPFIDTLTPGNDIEISHFTGDFDLERVDVVENLIMYAAGTGITPMISLINNRLKTQNDKQKVNLIFFNKTEKDIIWKAQFDKLQNEESWFSVQYVLSEPDKEWKGQTGRVRPELIADLPNGKSETSFLCACGPTPFTKCVMELACKKGYIKDRCHAFIG